MRFCNFKNNNGTHKFVLDDSKFDWFDDSKIRRFDDSKIRDFKSEHISRRTPRTTHVALSFSRNSCTLRCGRIPTEWQSHKRVFYPHFVRLIHYWIFWKESSNLESQIFESIEFQIRAYFSKEPSKLLMWLCHSAGIRPHCRVHGFLLNDKATQGLFIPILCA